MKKTLLGFACLSVLFGACTNEEIVSNQSQGGTCHLSDYIDWSAVGSAPESFALHLYPIDGSKPTSLYLTADDYYNDVMVPAGDYNVICINYDQEGYEGFEADFSTFEGAYIKATSGTALSGYLMEYTREYNAKASLQPNPVASSPLNQIQETRGFIIRTKMLTNPLSFASSTNTTTEQQSQETRGFNAQTSIKPRSFASSSLSSIKSDLTRGFNAKASIKPKSSIKPVTVCLQINGMSEDNGIVAINSVVTNLSAGISLADGAPLAEAIDQQLPDKYWGIVEDNDDKSLTLFTDFGTFGLAQVEDEEGVETRGFNARTSIQPRPPIKNLYQLQFADGTTKEFEVDVTEQLADQIEKNEEWILLNLSIDL